MNPLTEKISEEKSKNLLRASLQGDRQAMDELIRLHQPFIFNVAWKMTFDANDAMDLTQETLLNLNLTLKVTSVPGYTEL